jgi:TonB family protein
MPDMTLFKPEALNKTTRVEVRVTIDASGHVKSARIIRGEPIRNTALAQAILLAAQQWVFEPATWRGKRIESEHSIMFMFRARSQ